MTLPAPAFTDAILANVRPEIRDEVAYAIQLVAEASCVICEGTGRATWLDDCQECGAADAPLGVAEPVGPPSPGITSNPSLQQRHPHGR